MKPQPLRRKAAHLCLKTIRHFSHHLIRRAVFNRRFEINVMGHPIWSTVGETWHKQRARLHRNLSRHIRCWRRNSKKINVLILGGTHIKQHCRNSAFAQMTDEPQKPFAALWKCRPRQIAIVLGVMLIKMRIGCRAKQAGRLMAQCIKRNTHRLIITDMARNQHHGPALSNGDHHLVVPRTTDIFRF